MAIKLFITIFFVVWALGAITTLLREGMFAWVMTEFLVCLLVAMIFMTAVFFLAKRLKRYDLVDVAWGLSGIVIALTSFILQPGEIWEFDAALLVTALVIVWGARLSLHIGQRFINSSHEDARYIELRKNWRGNQDRNMYLRVFLLQAVLITLVSTPVIHINLFATPGMALSSLQNILFWSGGLAVWLIGFYFEKTADNQLRTFLSDVKNRNKLLTTGLRKYSRYPNYFGELVQWWGIFIICLSTPFGLVGIIGPVIISYLILFVSGVPPLETRFSQKPGWAEYKRRTNTLVPFKPKI